MTNGTKRRLSLILCVITLILPLAFGSNAEGEPTIYGDEPLNAVAASESVTVILDSSSKYVEANAQFTIDVYLESTAAIAGVQLMLSYNSTKATLTDYRMYDSDTTVAGSDFADETVTGEGAVHFKHDEVNHTLRFVAVSSKAEGYTKTGNQVHALTLTFTAGAKKIYASTSVVTLDIENADSYNVSNAFEGFTTVGNTSAEKIATNTLSGGKVVYNIKRKNNSCLAGDVNLDGRINAKDNAAVSKYIASQSSYDATVGNLDLNGDGRVNAKDSRLLASYLGGQINVQMY